MKPIEFKEQNLVFGENQKEYLPLPVLSKGKGVLSCWKLSDEEKKKILETGEIWHISLNFNKPLQAIFMSTDKEEALSALNDFNSEKKLEAISVGDEDQPIYSFVNGHVDLKTFSEAMKEEGWDGFENMKEDEIIHGYYTFENGAYLFYKEKGVTRNFIPCTYIEW